MAAVPWLAQLDGRRDGGTDTELLPQPVMAGMGVPSVSLPVQPGCGKHWRHTGGSAKSPPSLVFVRIRSWFLPWDGPKSHHCCGQEDCGGSWHLPGSGVPVLRGWEVGKGLALSTGSVVVFLALEILLSFSSSCWDQAQLALSPGCLLTAAGGSVRGPGVAEEGSSAPGGSQCHLPSKSPSLEVMWVSLPLITPWGTQEFWSPCVTHVAVG